MADIKVGDRVRIKENYPDYDGSNKPGVEFTVTAVVEREDPGTKIPSFFVRGDPEQWGVWELFIEKVEEKNVTVDVKKGDRIRATRDSDVIETTVIGRFGSGFETSAAVAIMDWQGWEIEILPKPLPTEPGYYVREDAEERTEFMDVYFLHEDGDWSCDFHTKWELIAEEEVPLNLVPLVKGER